MAQYWKHYVWEYLTCVAAASMLLLNTAQGFYIPDALADNVFLAVAACAALLAVFFLGGYNRVTLALVPCAAGALAVLALLLLRRGGVDITDSSDSGTAHYIYWFALVMVCVVVYLCGRLRLGVALLFLLGCCVHAVLQFLDYQVFAWASVVFAGSCVLLFWLRQYRCQAMNSSTAQPDFFRFFRSGLLMLLAAVVLSVGVFFAVIRPLGPPTMELKFLERYLAFNIIEHTGISDSYRLPDPERPTDRTDDTLSGTEDVTEGETPVDQQEDVLEDPLENAAGDEQRLEAPTGETPLAAVSYTVTPVSWVLLTVFLVLLALVLPPLLRVWLRKRRMRRMAALEPGQQVQALYRFYLKKFQRLGWKKRDGETPLEFAARSGQGLARYLSGTCGLEALTEAFVAARYGTEAPTEAVCAQCREMYDVFLKNCKRQLGLARYIRKFYVL